MNKYTNTQVSKMVVNPYTTEPILEKYEKLKEVISESAELQTDEEGFIVDWEKYFRYISFVYDQNSPMIMDYPALEQRKLRAAEEIEYEGDNYPQIAAIFVIFIINNRIWTEIVSNENVFDEYSIRVNKPISANLDEDKQLKTVELKNKMLTQMSDMRKRISILRNELFCGDEELIDSENKITKFTPSNVAKFMKEEQNERNLGKR